MRVHVTWINATEHYQRGSEVYRLNELGLATDASPADVYRHFLEYEGRCIGKVWIDHDRQPEPVHVGWIFQKRERYEDTGEPFLAETWVTLREDPIAPAYIAASKARP